MRHRLTGTILLLYPRRVRERHGPEIAALIDDLVAHEGRSRTGLFIRLAVDGLVQRAASTATVWTVVGVLAATSFGGLAVSDLAAATALRAVSRTAQTVAPASPTEPRRAVSVSAAGGCATARRQAGRGLRRRRSAPRGGPSHSRSGCRPPRRRCG